MKQYRAKEVITLGAGSLVQLTEKQAADRTGRIERAGAGRYRLKHALHFKAGEAFGFEGEIPKALADLVEQASAAKAAPEKKADEGAGAKKSGGLFDRAKDAVGLGAGRE